MRTLWIVAVLLLGVEGSLVQFEMMIMEVAKRSGLLWYSAYGCYCGWGGHGRPQDATDRCCFVHDCCYGKATDCNPKRVSYTYSEENGEIVCGEWMCGPGFKCSPSQNQAGADPFIISGQPAVPSRGDDPCGTQICECDKAAAICFRDNIPSYDNKYWLFPPKNCREEPEPC